MKKLIILTLFLAVIGTAQAQQEAMFTHYMFNTNAINPAYAGSRDALSINGLHRSQWVGLDGAPTTQTFNLHTPLWVKNTGVGLSFLQDKIGVTNTMSINADFSFKIKVLQKWHLAFGLKAGFDKMSDNFRDLNNAGTDIEFQENYESKFLPNFGAGLYLSSQRFYIGFSVPRLLKHELSENDDVSTERFRNGQRHYFMIAGAYLNMSDNMAFKPTTQIKATQGAPVEMDFTATLFFYDRIWLGAMFRTDDAVGMLIGVNVTEQLALGYSYDWSYANLSSYRNSHEILFRYDFVFKQDKKIHSPRYF